MSKFKITTTGLVILAISIYFSLFFVKKVNLTTADLGRHIQNGRQIFNTSRILTTNFYSYTQPDFPTVNHHWLSGVFYFAADRVGGFTAVSLLNWLLWFLTIFVVFKSLLKNTNWKFSALILALVMPVMATRTEIRPEVYSYLFTALYIFVFEMLSQNPTHKSMKLLTVLLLTIQLFWTNLHIFFIFGIMISGLYLLHNLVEKNPETKKFILIFAGLVLVSLINPFGLKGLLEPLNIFREYGYMLVENQSVFFMQKRFPSFVYFHFEILFVATTALLFSIKKSRSLALALLTLVFGIAAFKIHRLMPFFAISFVILAGKYISTIFIPESYGKKASMVFGLLFLTGLFIPGSYFSPFNVISGIGLFPNIQKSAAFFKDNNIKGPIFNNYDIGGYLIYNLYPRERVFVDNRPEAYSVDFFKKIYVPMQENEDIWKEKSAEYNLNVIYFYRHDATPWAQPFLGRRVTDPEWVPVFVDDYVLIMLKDNEINSEVIEKNKLPRDMFTTVPS